MIFGANGMLGASLTRYLSKNPKISIYACVRNEEYIDLFKGLNIEKVFVNIDILDEKIIDSVITEVKPDVVLNCVGIIKQLKESTNYTDSILINSYYPHKLAEICDIHGSRLIHFSTDCVFTGEKGNYSENDLPDAQDIYGRSKMLGEVIYGKHLTLRTSIIGHENKDPVSLIDWFLNQKEVSGYARAIFSGMPTVYVAEVLEQHIIFDDSIQGLVNLSVDPIDKYSLLKIVDKFYGQKCEISKNDTFTIDRSLEFKKLNKLTGYKPNTWPELIKKMNAEYNQYFSMPKLLRDS